MTKNAKGRQRHTQKPEAPKDLGKEDKAMVINVWKLDGYKIWENEEGELIWGAHVEDLLPDGSARIGLFTGWAVIKDDVLIMSPWKVSIKADEDDWEEVRTHMDSLPKWSRTTLFVKCPDSGENGLRFCCNSEFWPQNMADDVLLHTGLNKAKRMIP